MSVVSFIAENYAKVSEYRSPKKIKEAIVENIGRVYVLDSSEEFINKHSIVDLDKLSKREKNMFSFLLKDNPYADHIITEYNYGMSDFKELEDRVSLLKKLNSISELLKSYPYNEPEFAKNVLSKVIEWSFEGNQENIRLLSKSFNLFVDKNTINEFIGNDSIKKRDSFAILKGLESSDKTAEIKCSLITGTSAILAVAITPAINPIIEMTADLLPKISTYTGNNQFLNNVAIVGITLFAFYKTFQTVNKANKEFINKEKEKQIGFCAPEKNDKKNAEILIEHRILGELIRIQNFNASNPENEKYIGLCAFVAEKIKINDLKVPAGMIKEYRLTDKQVEKLNSLNIDEIHELSTIKNPTVRQYLMLGDFSYDEKNVLKTISIMQDIAGIDNNGEGKLLKDISTIKNIPSSLREKIESLPDNEKKVITAYVNLFTNKGNICNNKILGALQNNFNKENITGMLMAEMNVNYFNKQKEAPTNEELNYFKKIWNFIIQKEKVETVNSDVKDLITKISNKYNFNEAREINDAQPTLIGRVKNTEEMVIENIQKIREKVSLDSLGAIREKFRNL